MVTDTYSSLLSSLEIKKRMTAVVEKWFGDAFGELHPKLQELHRSGGSLAGSVEVQFGRGLAGLIGKRVAKRLGIPAFAGSVPLKVSIYSIANELHWDRTFNEGSKFASVFIPSGSYPSGSWMENAGVFRLKLGVSIVDGGWVWQPKGAWFWFVPMPNWLLPRTTASKRIDHDLYEFKVQINLPIVGKILAYGGKLKQQLVNPIEAA
jgi:hypothetical protein